MKKRWTGLHIDAWSLTMTNFERIKEMDAYEMAILLDEVKNNPCLKCGLADSDGTCGSLHANCTHGFYKWLMREAHAYDYD
mgnify:CR=1 FL=1